MIQVYSPLILLHRVCAMVETLHKINNASLSESRKVPVLCNAAWSHIIHADKIKLKLYRTIYLVVNTEKQKFSQIQENFPRSFWYYLDHHVLLTIFFFLQWSTKIKLKLTNKFNVYFSRTFFKTKDISLNPTERWKVLFLSKWPPFDLFMHWNSIFLHRYLL